MWNKDEVKGKAEQAKGAVKEKVGQMTGDENLEADGQEDKAIGKARETIGTARRKVEEVKDEVKSRLPKP